MYIITIIITAITVYYYTYTYTYIIIIITVITKFLKHFAIKRDSKRKSH